MKHDFLLLAVCSFLSAASSHILPSELRHASSSCHTAYGFGPEVAPLPTIHHSPTISRVTVTEREVARSTKSLDTPTRATSTVVQKAATTIHHRTRASVVTETITVPVTVTHRRHSRVTETAEASTFLFNTTISPVTLPTPSGFIPVESSLPGVGVLQRREGGGAEERAADSPDFTAIPAGFRPNGRARSVVCNTVLHSTITETLTATAVVNKLAHGERTATSTTTLTHVHHHFPNQPRSTITETHTVTITSSTTRVRTVTTTPTVTSTVAIPSYTFYAACAANNLVNQFNDYPIDGYGLAVASFDEQNESIVSYSYQPAASAYDCCVIAQQTPNSVVFFYQGFDFGPGEDQCLVFVSDQSCPIPSNQVALFGAIYNGTASQVGASYGNYIGNTNCGGAGFTTSVNYTVVAETGAEVTEGGGVTFQLGTDSELDP